jgi:quercetin dioxygenase-like cupin family protein
VVEFDEGQLRAAPGEAILIAAGERHRASVTDSCLLISIEPVGMRRIDVAPAPHP